MTNLLDGHQVPLYGDGGNVRDWIHVDDHCRGIQLVAERGQPGAVYHIDGDCEISNIELTDRLLDACSAGWDRVTRVADRKGHDRRYSLDDSALRGARLPAAHAIRRGPGRHRRLVPGEPRLVGAAAPASAAGRAAGTGRRGRAVTRWLVTGPAACSAGTWWRCCAGTARRSPR